MQLIDYGDEEEEDDIQRTEFKENPEDFNSREEPININTNSDFMTTAPFNLNTIDATQPSRDNGLQYIGAPIEYFSAADGAIHSQSQMTVVVNERDFDKMQEIKDEDSLLQIDLLPVHPHHHVKTAPHPIINTKHGGLYTTRQPLTGREMQKAMKREKEKCSQLSKDGCMGSGKSSLG
jgi:hypothetical protein